ncbi:MAG: DNA mismatch repair endonuclease MutL [Ruminococcaceae bacterium]|nr:DNA mismatch repair endonuclease MutL [Oscillospiraceae bacterium]
MAEIKVLPQAVANKIAAGEVVERPSAAIKELVENSIDAGASEIRVEIKNGGIKYISVQDNGKGIPKDELEFAFIRHATSKLREIEDLYEIQTMGFRGEALASICSVAEVQVLTRCRDAEEGVTMTVKHGVASPKCEVACNFGTTMIVENLFANIPARMKFLKKDSTEAGYVTDVLGRIALANPSVAFRYISDGKEVFSTSGDGQLKNVILNIYGIDHAKAVCEADYSEHGVRVHGMVGKAELARGNRTRQTLLVNGRYIKNHVVSKVVEEAYRNVLMTGKFPFFVLNIDLSPQLVDVNVHPAKTEIKFANEKEIYNIVHTAVKNALYKITAQPVSATPVPEVKPMQAPEIKSVPVPEVKSAAPAKSEPAAPDRKIIREFMQNTVPDTSAFERETRRVTAFNEPTPMIDKFFERFEEKPKVQSSVAEDIKPQPVVVEENPIEVQKPEQLDLFEEQTAEVYEQVLPIKVVGQVFDTYLVCQQGDSMYLIDQHAAHERKRFEMLKADYTSKKTSGQMLLTPIVLDVDAVELQAVKDNAQMLSDMGFEMEEFGRSSVIIRETPFIGDEDEIKALATEVIVVLKDGRPMGLLSFEERLLDMISCKYAIKANKGLSHIELEALVKIVEELEKDGITTCPHGRPIKIAFTKREIEKMFKRIV